MIAITPYRDEWPETFHRLGRQIRDATRELALRIDHIGSTSIPGLAAKDIIDIQLTAAGLTPALMQALCGLGYQHVAHITQDHVPPGADSDAQQWTKWYFKIREDKLAVNLHVRLNGAANQRYALLFRDYLRAHADAAEAYARVKHALARLHPDDIEAYCDVKDPVCDIIMAAALEWALAVRWNAGPSDC